MWIPGGRAVDNLFHTFSASPGTILLVGRFSNEVALGPLMDDISRNIEAVRGRIAMVLSRSGRSPGEVILVAVTKTLPAEVVGKVIRAGIPDIGENRVQELVAKSQQVTEPCRWHLIGPLQRNKVRKVVGLAHTLQAIDGLEIAEAVDRVARERNLIARVLLEVNASNEASKHGVSPRDAPRVADGLMALGNLDWQGLMTIGPLDAGIGATRDCFRRLRQLAEDLRGRTGRALPELSMGMSDDFEVAIEEGATIVRLGRAITGERK
jgi:PLP dependent protein